MKAPEQALSDQVPAFTRLNSISQRVVVSAAALVTAEAASVTTPGDMSPSVVFSAPLPRPRGNVTAVLPARFSISSSTCS
jgi:hypothetical protein